MPILADFQQIEGRGNGVKTVIENMSDIAAALERPPTCTSFSCVFLAKLTFRKKKSVA